MVFILYYNLPHLINIKSMKKITHVATMYINKSSNSSLYVQDFLLIWLFIWCVHGIITICIGLTLGLFWHNLHSFHAHSMDKIFSMLKQCKFVGYWFHVVIAFVMLDFPCCCISHKIQVFKMLRRWYSFS